MLSVAIATGRTTWVVELRWDKPYVPKSFKLQEMIK